MTFFPDPPFLDPRLGDGEMFETNIRSRLCKCRLPCFSRAGRLMGESPAGDTQQSDEQETKQQQNKRSEAKASNKTQKANKNLPGAGPIFPDRNSGKTGKWPPPPIRAARDHNTDNNNSSSSSSTTTTPPTTTTTTTTTTTILIMMIMLIILNIIIIIIIILVFDRYVTRTFHWRPEDFPLEVATCAAAYFLNMILK